MRFKYTAIAAACMALAPFVHAQYGTSSQGGTPTDRPAASATGSTAQDSTRMASQGSMNDPATIRHLQEQLAQKGFDPGPIDGVMGPQTRAALRDYQQSKGLKQGSGIDRATLDSLGVPSSGTSRHDTSAVGEGTMGTAPSQRATPSATAAPSSAGKPSTSQPTAGTSRHDAGATGEGTMGTAPQQQTNQARGGTASTTPSNPTTTPSAGGSGTTTPPMPGGTTPADTRSAGEGTMGTSPSQQPNSPRK